ncbi:MAG: hypothetical protein ACREE0_21240 [Phenylobacterium sp.]
MKTALALSAALALVATTVAAQAPPAPTVIRGKVVSATETTLNVQTASGAQVVALTPTWSVTVAEPVKVDAIQPGSFIGTAEMPNPDGSTGTSLEVHVFPPGVKMGEGHYGWDLKPGSMMTNGTVGTVVKGKAGSRELDVNYSYGTRHITVPSKVPIVQFTSGTHAQVKSGTPVFMVVQRGKNGGLMAGNVVIGKNGAKPPM